MYYKIDNFFGNHRNFIKSRSYSQLRGEDDADVSNCSPITENHHIRSNLVNLDGVVLDEEDEANPCGLIAKYLFTDTFKLIDTASTNEIEVDKDDIANSIDRNRRFQNPDDYREVQWHENEDEHLMVWFQTDAFPIFIKLWGAIDIDLEKDKTYTLRIDNQWDDEEIDAKKYVYLSETNFFGGDNITFGVIYLAGGGIFFILWLILIILEIMHRFFPRKVKINPNHRN